MRRAGESPAERACGGGAGGGRARAGRSLAARGGGLGLAGEAENLADAGPDGRSARAAEAEAIRVFARNLKDLLLAAPAGARRRWGLIRASAPG